MNTDLSLMQRVLGTDWAKLPPVIQRHYQITRAQKSVTVTGTLAIDYPFWVTPILMITRLMGALIDAKGENRQLQVQKWLTNEPLTLYWRRDIHVPNGKHTVFSSRMEFQKDHELIEFVGGGFGIRLRLSVEDGKLVYRSQGHLLKVGKFIIPIADWLILGQATISEQALSDDAFVLDFQIVHPLWGRTYYYGGVFHLSR
jgi:hypothetical protein